MQITGIIESTALGRFFLKAAISKQVGHADHRDQRVHSIGKIFLKAVISKLVGHADHRDQRVHSIRKIFSE